MAADHEFEKEDLDFKEINREQTEKIDPEVRKAKFKMLIVLGKERGYLTYA